RPCLSEHLLPRHALHVVDGFRVLLHGGHQLCLIVGLLGPAALTLDALLHSAPPRKIEPGYLRSWLERFGECLAIPYCGFTWRARGWSSEGNSCCGKATSPGGRAGWRSSTWRGSGNGPFPNPSWPSCSGRNPCPASGRVP